MPDMSPRQQPQRRPAVYKPDERAALAKLIKEHREHAKLTQTQLADRAKISPTTVKNLESGQAPFRSTLARLIDVPELKLSWEFIEIALRSANVDSAAVHTTLRNVSFNFFLAPEYDSIRMLAEFRNQLNAYSGQIEQTFIYLDHKSATDFIALSNCARYQAAFRTNMPLEAMAKKITTLVEHGNVDIIALGCGDGKQETRLIQHLMDEMNDPSIRLYLVDISQPLLNYAYKHVADTFNDRRGISYFAMQANFHQLPRYEQITYLAPHSKRRKIYTMLGLTFSNLDNEIRFIRDSLSAAAEGDYLLIDIICCYADPNNTTAIKKQDPILTMHIPEEYTKWLGGPIQRYSENVNNVAFESCLSKDCVIRGSYAIDIFANVTLRDCTSRRYSMARVRRYSPNDLVETLSELGWHQEEIFRYGNGHATVCNLILFQRAGMS